MTMHAIGKHSKGDWRPYLRKTDRQWMVITDASPLAIASVTDFGGMPAMDNTYLIAASPEAYELAMAVSRALDPDSGPGVSDVTRQEMETIRKLAEQFLAKVERGM